MVDSFVLQWLSNKHLDDMFAFSSVTPKLRQDQHLSSMLSDYFLSKRCLNNSSHYFMIAAGNSDIQAFVFLKESLKESMDESTIKYVGNPRDALQKTLKL